MISEPPLRYFSFDSLCSRSSGTPFKRTTLCLAAACWASTFFFVNPAVAGDKEKAKALFNEGIEQMEAGHYDKACPDIAESYRLDPYPGTLFTLAECEAKRGRIATAVTRYDEYLGLYAKLPPDKKAKQGTRQRESMDQKAALEPQVPWLTLVLPPNSPENTVVKYDGASLAKDALGVMLPVDPGEHVIVTQAPGGAVTELHITIVKGEKQTHTLPVKVVNEAKAALRPAPPPRDRYPRSRGAGERQVPAWAWASGAVGIAAFGVGIAFAVDYVKVRNTVATGCPDNICDADKYSLEAAQVLRGRWNRDLGLALGFSAAGLSGLGTAVTSIVLSKRRGEPTSAAPAVGITLWYSPRTTGATVHGAF